MDNDSKLNELLQKIENLSLQIEKYKDDIKLIKDQVSGFKNSLPENEATRVIKSNSAKKFLPNFENFIGLKLINFTGIIVLIAGLIIGVKYVIDIDLISPLMRIALTYSAGAILFFISLKLRKKYEVFSMVLFSGSMASLYFTTYAACEYYTLLPVTTAFILMLALTFFTVYNSLKYNRQEIAILGLVGAYGIPFFVRGDAESMAALFSYILIINLGVLLISFKKYWLSLLYFSFFTTWLIYLSWIMIYAEDNAGKTGLFFCYAFFIFFVLNSLAFKFIKRLAIAPSDTFIIILNTILLYCSLLLLYQGYQTALIEIITLCFGIIYLAAAIAVKKYISVQAHFYNALFGISMTALVTFAGIKYMGFTLTIIWVIMAVIMFVTGMLFKLKLFRIAAILLFAVTLIKLLLVDSIKFNSIEKVSAYIIIGIVLLIISFLYQKYKKIIFETENH